MHKCNLIKTAAAPTQGEYTPTLIDQRKAEAQVLIEYANGGSYTVRLQHGADISVVNKRSLKQCYANGMYEVTERGMEQLKAQYTWHTNF